MDKKQYWIILNGRATSGKDTFKNIVSKYKKSISISSVDKVKEAAYLLDWNGEKDELGRKALSDLKDLSTKYFDHPFKYVAAQLEEFKNSDYEIFTIDVREPNDIKRLVKEYGFITLLIDNPRLAYTPDNHADQNVYDYYYDYVIFNGGSFKDFEKNIAKFLADLDDFEQ